MLESDLKTGISERERFASVGEIDLCYETFGAADSPPVLRDERAASYTLDDVAADAVGLLDQLGIDSAHVVGLGWAGCSPS